MRLHSDSWKRKMQKMRKKENSQAFIILLIVFLALISAGCKKKETPPPPPSSPPAPTVKHETKPAPPVQKQASSVHVVTDTSPVMDFTKRKDPFKQFGIEVKPQESPVFSSKPGLGLLPIQNYEVGQFRVLGIVVGLKQNNALIVDPAGKAYVVKPGMDIGKNGGQIEKITATTIEVLEKYRNENGKIVKRIVKLTLPKKE